MLFMGVFLAARASANCGRARWQAEPRKISRQFRKMGKMGPHCLHECNSKRSPGWSQVCDRRFRVESVRLEARKTPKRMRGGLGRLTVREGILDRVLPHNA